MKRCEVARSAVFVCLLAAGAAAQSPPLFVEVAAPSDAVWVQQAVPIVLRVGYDAQYLAEHAIPLFQQRLDQPFQVVVPWLAASSERIIELREAATGPRIASGDRALRWTEAGSTTRGGRDYRLLELRVECTPLIAGLLALPPVEVNYAFSERFEQDFLRGRQPVERRDGSVRSASVELHARDLPTQGRPAAFSGAVGDFTAVTRTSRQDLAVGESFALELEVTGDGNLRRMAPPAWPELLGFVVQGLVERRTPTARIFVFDVLPVRLGATQVPAVSFTYFSPTLGQYRTTTAPPIEVQVAPASGQLPDRVRELIAADAAAVRDAAAWPWWCFVLLAAGGLLLALVVMRRSHRRARRRSLLQARQSLALAPAEGPGHACTSFLAFCAQCAELTPVPAGIDPVLAALASRGVSAAVVASVQLTHAALDAARYGGTAPPVEQMLEVADGLLTACGCASRA